MLVGVFDQEKTLVVGAFSMIVKSLSCQGRPGAAKGKLFHFLIFAVKRVGRTNTYRAQTSHKLFDWFHISTVSTFSIFHSYIFDVRLLEVMTSSFMYYLDKFIQNDPPFLHFYIHLLSTYL